MNSLVCPISKEKVNKNVVRITGFLIATLIGLYAFTGNIYFILFITADFIIRAFTSLKYSPLSWFAKQISGVLRLKPISIDKPPKIFASRVGFIFSMTMVILYYINPTSSVIVGLILMSFALLESLFNFCVGCVVYTYVILPLNNRGNNS